MIYKQAVVFLICVFGWISGGYCAWQALPGGVHPVLDVAAKLLLSFIVPPVAAVGLCSVAVIVIGSVYILWEKSGEFVRAMEGEE